MHLHRRTRTPCRLAQKLFITRARRPKRKGPCIGVIVRAETDDHVRHASIGIRTHDERAIRGRQIEGEPPLFFPLRIASRIEQEGMLPGNWVLRAAICAEGQAFLLSRKVHGAPCLFAREFRAATPQLAAFVLLERVPNAHARVKPRVNAQLTTLFEVDTRRTVNDIRIEGKHAARLRLLARRSHAAARKQAVVRERHRFVVGAFNVEHPAQH